MEVHSHTHTPRKKWTHYFWEFIMLFLAVFCGFLAENFREHQVEHQREKQYIRSLIQDIKTDTSNINEWSEWYIKIQKACNTVLDKFDTVQHHFSGSAMTNFFYILDGFPDFIYTDRTMQQLKNAGGLRLIRKSVAVDSIIAYDQAVRDLLIEETGVSLYYDELHKISVRMLSYQKIVSHFGKLRSPGLKKEEQNYWFTQDPGMFEQLYNWFYKYRLTVNGFNRYLLQLKGRGGRLMNFLKEKYHFD
ncbi:MAG TPA: hypothetical protein VLJ68_12765 [Chitinophagaceae bacterium]|nr:hypothetical protein [Chitinophagaceae bacterium]